MNNEASNSPTPPTEESIIGSPDRVGQLDDEWPGEWTIVDGIRQWRRDHGHRARHDTSESEPTYAEQEANPELIAAELEVNSRE
jgi:hypothetical protein